MDTSNQIKMKAYDIYITDIQRILFGGMPPVFALEVIVRTAVIYFILMVAIRMMGKRMASQLGRNELAAMVSLAAAIGIPIQDPDRGLIPAVLIATVIVIFQRLVAHRAATSEKFEKISQDALSTLVYDGKIDTQRMQRARLSRERLFAQLRSEGIKQLGEVKRFYLEANGSFSLIRKGTPTFGLSIIPSIDREFEDRMDTSDRVFVCNNCGMTEEAPIDELKRCEFCDAVAWKQAVQEIGA
jgi:uncharacterized membrane protein YcaP (DUF421 family)